jgi:hypothetical protein
MLSSQEYRSLLASMIHVLPLGLMMKPLLGGGGGGGVDDDDDDDAYTQRTRTRECAMGHEHEAVPLISE